MNKQKISKEIDVLDDFEHVLLKPTIYVGSTDIIDEKMPIIKDNLIIEDIKKISVGMYKILHEVIDNALDEAKRQNGMPYLKIYFNSKDNSVEIIDSGGGFVNAEKIHNKTKVSIVETAMTKLRSGSNFKNDEIEENIIGTNGMGVSLTNMLSSYFSITTKNSKIEYTQIWENFKSIRNNIIKRNSTKNTGTSIKFIPRSDIFFNYKWDKDIITTQMKFRNFLIKNDDILKNINFQVYWDENNIIDNNNFYPYDSFIYKNQNISIIIYKSYNKSIRASFINGTQTTSTGQKQIHEILLYDIINNSFDYKDASNFYETIISINIPPKYVKFADQNKTRFISNRNDIENILNPVYLDFLSKFKKTTLFNNIKNEILLFKNESDIKKIKKIIKDDAIKISNKYYSPSKKKQRLFLCEGISAAGSLAQKRNKEYDGVYALRGKVENTYSLSEITKNKELLELIKILNLDINSNTMDYDEIIISADADVDGGHIECLLLNFFWKWFPHIIKESKLFLIDKPLVSCIINNKIKYFYSLNDFNTYIKNNSDKSIKNIRYLKGLGSYNIQDWDYIFKNMKKRMVKIDKNSNNILNIAFGESSEKRKEWLKG